MIGFGIDSHPLVEGLPLILGGVHIPFSKGLKGNSDGDVVIHALIDALCGATGRGGIGLYFPQTTYHDSRILLRRMMPFFRFYHLINLDLTIIAESPRLSPYTSMMQSNLARDMRCSSYRINIKATSTNGLGFIGRKEGIMAYAHLSLDFL